jgi:hypothetical protein
MTQEDDGHSSIVLRRRLALSTVALTLGALLALRFDIQSLREPFQNMAYRVGLSAQSPAVKAVETDVSRLRAALRLSDRQRVEKVSGALKDRFDALTPVERSEVRPDVEVELLRARQFLLTPTGSLNVPPNPVPPNYAPLSPR